MRIVHAVVAASAVLVVSLPPALAQDPSMAGRDMGAMDLPGACRTTAAPEMPGMAETGTVMEGMDGHTRSLMEAVMPTHMPMMQAVMAEDPDIAFACGMIPHHLGAIGMARIELEMGSDQEMRVLAQTIIDDQIREIEQLVAWIEKQGE